MSGEPKRAAVVLRRIPATSRPTSDPFSSLSTYCTRTYAPLAVCLALSVRIPLPSCQPLALLILPSHRNGILPCVLSLFP